MRACVSPKTDVIEIEKNRRYGRTVLLCSGMNLNTIKHITVTINGVNIFIKNPASIEVNISKTRVLIIQRAIKLLLE